MRNNTSVSLGNHFEMFVEDKISQGRYKNASEVIRAGLRLLEDEEKWREQKAQAIIAALEEGEASGIAEDFDFDRFLERMHAEADAKSSYND